MASREILAAAPDLAAWLRSKEASSLPEQIRISLEQCLTAAGKLKQAELGLGLVQLISVVRRAIDGMILL